MPRGSRIEFFADSNDWQQIIAMISGVPDLILVSRCSPVNEQNVQLTCASMLEDYVCDAEQMRGLEAFLIIKRNTKLMHRTILMGDGSGIRTVIDQNFNPDSAVLFLGIARSERTLVLSDLSTTGETVLAEELYSNIKKIIIKDSIRVDGYYLCPGAKRKLLSGWRLAPREESPSAADLRAEDLPDKQS